MSNVLEAYFNPEAIELAYHRVQCGRDKLCKDKVGLRAFGVNVKKNCEIFSEDIINNKYNPQAGFKFYVPKKTSKKRRTKTLLFVEDAIVYQAIADFIAKKKYVKLTKHKEFVFGSVLSYKVNVGIGLLKEEKPKYFFFQPWEVLYENFKKSIYYSINVDKVKYKLETDITGFFDSIPHYNLLDKLSKEFHVEDEILKLLGKCLNIWSGTRNRKTPGFGVPQGSAPSFLFANIMLHGLDDEIIGKGLRYCRYIDDIKIFAYEEKELKEILDSIDGYLKSNGLSKNTKKTKIEAISENQEDATLKEMRKIRTLPLYEMKDEEIPLPPSICEEITDKNEKQIFSSNTDENEKQIFFSNTDPGGLRDEEEFIQYFEKKMREVKKKLPNLFIDGSKPIESLELKESSNDIDFIELSVLYNNSLRSLKKFQSDITPDEVLLKYWFFAYKKFFWRADCFSWTIILYKNNKAVKKYLLEIVTEFTSYEWVRYFALQTLSFSQSFDERELRGPIFKMLVEEKSDFVKISLYRLLFLHTKNKQFIATLIKKLKKETHQYLQILIINFNKNYNSEKIDIPAFLTSIGL